MGKAEFAELAESERSSRAAWSWAGPTSMVRRSVVSLWLLVRAVPRRWWIAILGGALPMVWLVLDHPLGIPLVVVIAIAAHGCLGAFALRPYGTERLMNPCIVQGGS